MAQKPLPIQTLLFLLLTAPPPSHSLSYTQYRNLLSISHSLMSRVANLRATRGDYAGSRRAELIAEKMERGLGLGFWGLTWSVGWDYVKNYAWRGFDYTDLYDAVSDMNELAKSLGEFTRAKSDAEKAAWIGQNYQNILRVTKSMFGRLLKVFRQSGALREVIKMVQSEVVDGGLMKDCLELGSGDLKWLILNFKDLVLQFYPIPDFGRDEL